MQREKNGRPAPVFRRGKTECRTQLTMLPPGKSAGIIRSYARDSSDSFTDRKTFASKDLASVQISLKKEWCGPVIAGIKIQNETLFYIWRF
jgi:hypothetical protein